jgi:glutamate carboxypeptidase
MDGQMAFGPGVADAKGAAAVAWLAVAAGSDVLGSSGPNLHVLLNTDEESGSVESRTIIQERARIADLAFVFEPARPDGSIVVGRRGVRRYQVAINGRAAHSGVEPWKGINAIEAAAHKVLALQAMNDRRNGVSVTVAMIHGGLGMNTIPPDVRLGVDTRFRDDGQGIRLDSSIADVLRSPSIPGSSATWTISSERPSMVPHPQVRRLVAEFKKAAGILGFGLRAVATGGASDGCFTSSEGVPTIDGLGPVGGGYHTNAEFVVRSTLVDRAAMTASVLAARS